MSSPEAVPDCARGSPAANVGEPPTATDARGTLASWITAELGRPPKPGDSIDFAEARIVVRRIRRGRVFEAMLTRA